LDKRETPSDPANQKLDHEAMSRFEMTKFSPFEAKIQHSDGC
jgi:hypothetical protein